MSRKTECCAGYAADMPPADGTVATKTWCSGMLRTARIRVLCRSNGMHSTWVPLDVGNWRQMSGTGTTALRTGGIPHMEVPRETRNLIMLFCCREVCGAQDRKLSYSQEGGWKEAFVTASTDRTKEGGEHQKLERRGAPGVVGRIHCLGGPSPKAAGFSVKKSDSLYYGGHHG